LWLNDQQGINKMDDELEKALENTLAGRLETFEIHCINIVGAIIEGFIFSVIKVIKLIIKVAKWIDMAGMPVNHSVKPHKNKRR